MIRTGISNPKTTPTIARKKRVRAVSVTLAIGAVLILASDLPAPANAQVNTQINSIDFPYELHNNRETIIGGLGAALFGGAMLAKSNQDPLTSSELAGLPVPDTNAFDRGAIANWNPNAARVSDILVGCLASAPVLFSVTKNRCRKPGVVLAMYGETLLLANGVAHTISAAVDRYRPFVYNNDPDIPESKKLSVNAKHSFPSSHTSNAFASAVFLSRIHSKLHPDSRARRWVWAGSLGTAATIGWLRYEAGRHYRTDVIAGAVFGSLIGYLVPEFHTVQDNSGTTVVVGMVGYNGTSGIIARVQF